MSSMMKAKGKNEIKVYNSGSSGSITVFFVVIFLSVILLTGSMVDVSRIMTADNKMDSAMRASTKSLLSAYNKELMGSYGIFAVDLKENEKVFSDYLKTNLDLSSTGFMKYQLNEGSVSIKGDMNQTLNNINVLEEQIKAYMETKEIINSEERIAGRVLGGIQSLLDSNIKNIIKSGTKSEKVLLKDGVVLGKSSDQIEDDTPRLLEEAQRVLKEDSDMVKRDTAQIAESFMKEALPGVSCNPRQGGRERERRLAEIGKEIGYMKAAAQEVNHLIEEIDAELSRDEPDYDYIEQLEAEKIEELDKYDNAQNEIKKLNSAISTVEAENRGKSRADMGYIKDKMSQYSGFNEPFRYLEAPATGPEGVMPDEAHVPGMLHSVLQTMREIRSIDPDGAADRDTIMEYVLDRCTYATSATDRQLSHFKYGEVEYIINGSSGEGANLLTVMLKIFLFCFVVDVMDLVLSEVPLVPAALIAGLVYAGYSIWDLLSGNKYVPLELFLSRAGLNGLDDSLGLSYSDFLYFQLISVSRQDMLNRLKKLMVANANAYYDSSGKPHIDAQKLYTNVKTEAEVKVNLLFLPMLPLDELGINGFEGDCYRIKKSHSYGYQ